MLAICWIAELSGRVANVMGQLPSAPRDALGVISLLALCFASYKVISRASRFTSIRLLTLAGVMMLVVFQIGDVLDEIPSLAANPYIGKAQLGHQVIEHFVLVTGTLLLVMAFNLAVLDGDQAVRELELEHRLLLENVRERERAEQALRDAQAALEATVSRRTAELAERNGQLQIELQERVRFEETLARRLRYEEGLAACSGVLLADAEPHEAISHALRHLLTASQCSRVYVFENSYSTELGPFASLTHEVWDESCTSWCQPTPGLRLEYNRGLQRWREMLAHGEPMMAAVSTMPASERTVLERFQTKAILLLPIGWEGRWRGFLGFDDAKRERTWSSDEVRMLRTAAEMISACKERQRAEEALRQAYDELERRVDDRTSDLSRANEQLSREVADRHRAESEKRKLEQQLRQAQKMQAIGTLAGGIAHDFNNILASIIGYTELGLRRMDTSAMSENGLPKYFSEVLKAANRARELVRQILIFSRQSDAERTTVYPHLIAQEVIALMRASCPANVDIVHHLNAEAGAVLGDPIQIHQVLLNLCTNAQHALKRGGGTIEVVVESIDLDTDMQTSHGNLKRGGYVLITVADTGHGMDGGTLERIFEPFFTTKSVNEGTGMGLAIVHGIVIGQGGAITVQTALNHGTSFQAYLPRYEGPSLEAMAPKNESLNGSERIMVVDDEPQLVSLWTELLQSYGYVVTPFSSSLGAWESFRDEPEQYDLILLDQTMPGMTGAELAESILRERPGMPIIMATGFSESMTPETARRIGISDFVYKPILGNDLAMAIRKAIDRSIAATN